MKQQKITKQLIAISESPLGWLYAIAGPLPAALTVYNLESRDQNNKNTLNKPEAKVI